MADLQSNINQAFEDLAARFSKRYGLKSKKYLKALVMAIAQGDGYLETLLEQVRENLRITSAGGKFLNAAAAKYGVERPLGSGIGDSDYQKLVPLVGPSPKMILSTLQGILDVAYGPYTTATNLTCNLPEPYNLSAGSDLRFMVDAQELIVIEFQLSDAANLAAALASELANAISARTDGKLIGSVVIDPKSGDKFLNIRTSTIGNQGFLKAIGGDAQHTLQLGTIRPIVPGTGTWVVTQYGTSDEMLFTLSSGTDPDFSSAQVQPGDSVTIRKTSGFNAKNTGTFLVSAAGSGFFRVHNNAGVPETTATTHNDDLTFFRAYTANILQGARLACMIEDSPEHLLVTLPVSSPMNRRNPRTAWYQKGAIGTATAATLNTLTLNTVNNFTASGAIKPASSRLAVESSITAITSNTISVANIANFPTQGSVFSSVTRTHYYYSGISGNTLQNVTPSPTSDIVGSNARWSERYLYTSILGATLQGVFPDPSSLVGFDVLQASIPKANGILGSYLFDTKALYQVFSETALLTDQVNQGDFITILHVDDVSNFPSSGYVVFESFTENNEGPIPYLAKAGNTGLIVSLRSAFQKTHLKGTQIRLASLGAYEPSPNNTDYPVWMCSSAPIRDQIENFLLQVIAANFITEFQIITPEMAWPLAQEIYSSSPTATIL